MAATQYQVLKCVFFVIGCPSKCPNPSVQKDANRSFVASKRYSPATAAIGVVPQRWPAKMSFSANESLVMRRMKSAAPRCSGVVARGAHAVLLLDRAGWHTTGNLKVAKNMPLIFLP